LNLLGGFCEAFKKKEFCLLPEGAVFFFYDRSCFKGVCIKGKSIKFEGEYTDFFFSATCSIENNGSLQLEERLLRMEKDSSVSFPLEVEVEERDGYFDNEDRYLVLEKIDVRRIINTLSK